MCVVIVSGGMDSVTLLHEVVRDASQPVLALSFAYGQRHQRELQCASTQTRRLGCDHRILDLAALAPALADSALTDEQRAIPKISEAMGDPQPPTYVPNRNMLFLAIAVALAETTNRDTVYYGAQKHDLYGYWDTTPEFIARLNAVYGLNRKQPVRIVAPFMHLSKSEVLKRGLALGVDYDETWSCYAGGERACGVCPTCAERLAAFKEVGLSDPLVYNH
ncbi:7-cyano-7-deazaguanine synthase QueC [Trinickia sp. LjRoot230]|uniref:7-cyano-7-deazaguanine synthase QueC n=1 Tax=Trinickia sp. LjRoot230 TaxID=3342288 RepID=UPI003ED06A44